MHSKNKMASGTSHFKKDISSGGKDNKEGGSIGFDKDKKVLKVSWERIGDEYTAHRLREIFEKFGVVEDVVIKSSKKKGSALVVAATGNVLGHLSNPLLVLPLQTASTPSGFSAERNEPDGPTLSNLVGAGYQAFEESVLDKLMKKASQRPK